MPMEPSWCFSTLLLAAIDEQSPTQQLHRTKDITMIKKPTSVAVTMKSCQHNDARLPSSISADCSLYASLSHAGDVVSPLSQCSASPQEMLCVLSTTMPPRLSCARWSIQPYRKQLAQSRKRGPCQRSQPLLSPRRAFRPDHAAVVPAESMLEPYPLVGAWRAVRVE